MSFAVACDVQQARTIAWHGLSRWLEVPVSDLQNEGFTSVVRRSAILTIRWVLWWRCCTNCRLQDHGLLVHLAGADDPAAYLASDAPFDIASDEAVHRTRALYAVLFGDLTVDPPVAPAAMAIRMFESGHFGDWPEWCAHLNPRSR